MELTDIYALLTRFEGSSATVLDLEIDGAHLRLEKGGQPVFVGDGQPVPYVPTPPAVATPATSKGTLVTAPLVGTFYAAPSPDQAPFVKVGDRVELGQTLCVLEAMKMMSEVPAPCAGTISEVLAQDGDFAPFDTPLFRILEG